MGFKSWEEVASEATRPVIRLGNSFSLNMLPKEGANLQVRELDPEEVETLKSPDLRINSVVGHQPTADLISLLLGREIACNRANISLWNGEIFYIAQVVVGRLPEGKVLSAQELTSVEMRWLKVEVEYFPSTITRLNAEEQSERDKMELQELEQETPSDEPEEVRIAKMRALFGI